MKTRKMQRMTIKLECDTLATVHDLHLHFLDHDDPGFWMSSKYGTDRGNGKLAWCAVIQADVNAIRPRRPDPVPAKAKRARK